MKKRRLNKNGKIAVSLLIFLISAIIYVLMAFTGKFVKYSIFYQAITFCGYIWIFMGQIIAYYMIWGE